MDCSDAHRNLFGTGVPGSTAALKRSVPSQTEYPDECAQEYAAIAVKKIQQTSGMKQGWPPFIQQGLRLLVLEKIFKARGLSISGSMRKCLEEVKKSSEIAAAAKR